MSDTRNANDPYALQPDYTKPVEDLLGTTESGNLVGQATAQPAENQTSAAWILLRELLETIILSLIIFLLIRQVVQNYRIESHSMQPNFYEGEFILVNKLAFKLGVPERGEVIVFHNPNNVEEDYIKRVIGLPGDTIEIHEQTVLINGEVFEEPYQINAFRPGENFGPETIPPDQLFVMGDNRGNSSDSRRIGTIPEELVVGQAWLRVWPMNRWGLIKHYNLEPGAPVISQAIP
ncbi:MAG: signal peptidase I [Caldilineaceae bacterium]|nr:signal peptidase I [Caldilineaceae bacterium]